MFKRTSTKTFEQLAREWEEEMEKADCFAEIERRAAERKEERAYKSMLARLIRDGYVTKKEEP